MEENTEGFFNIYSNLPIEERNKVIVILKGEPVSWSLAYHEIKNKTKKGQMILKILKDLDIL